MSKKIQLCLLIYVVIGSMIFMNWGLVQEGTSTKFDRFQTIEK